MKNFNRSVYDIPLHEALEPLSVLVGLYSGQGCAVFAQEYCLGQSFGLFGEVPLLEVVNDGEVIDTFSVDETVGARHELAYVLLLLSLMLGRVLRIGVYVIVYVDGGHERGGEDCIFSIS